MPGTVYKTKQRQAILDLLDKNTDCHLTADEIFEALAKNSVRVSRTTVYRYLDMLVNEGVVRKFDQGNGEKSCFQIVSDKGCHEHYHLKCTGCGKLIHLECELVKELEKHISEEHGFKIDQTRTVFYGLCENCKKEPGEKDDA